MKGFALGVLRMTETEFGKLHPKDYWAAVSAYNKAEDGRQIYMGEILRGATYRIVMPFIKNRNIRIDQFWPMPWDREHKQKKVTERINRDKKFRKKSLKQFLDKINGTEN